MKEIATLWFPDEEAYTSYKEACAGHDEMAPYPVWLKKAESAKIQYATQGVRIIEVYASAEAFVAFCAAREINPDSKGRGMKKGSGLNNCIGWLRLKAPERVSFLAHRASWAVCT